MARRFRKQTILATLRETKGNMTRAASALGYDRKHLYRVVKGYKLEDALEEIKEQKIDVAEDTLYTAAANGNVTAAIFILKCQAKHRGWIERTEHTGPDGEPIQTKVIVLPQKEYLQETTPETSTLPSGRRFAIIEGGSRTGIEQIVTEGQEPRPEA
jgi:hypothetical protein